MQRDLLVVDAVHDPGRQHRLVHAERLVAQLRGADVLLTVGGCGRGGHLAAQGDDLAELAIERRPHVLVVQVGEEPSLSALGRVRDVLARVQRQQIVAVVLNSPDRIGLGGKPGRLAGLVAQGVVLVLRDEKRGGVREPRLLRRKRVTCRLAGEDGAVAQRELGLREGDAAAQVGAVIGDVDAPEDDAHAAGRIAGRCGVKHVAGRLVSALVGVERGRAAVVGERQRERAPLGRA